MQPDSESSDPAPAPASAPAAPIHDPYAALRVPEYRRYLAGHVIGVLGLQMQAVAVGWEIYRRTGNKLSLGLVGLVQVLPMLLLALPAGQAIDRFDRRRIVTLAAGLFALAAAGLAAVTAWQLDIRLMYGCLLVAGIARTLQQPAKASFLPQIVPWERFSNAVTWNMWGFQVAASVGPALGGLVIYLTGGAAAVFVLDCLAAVAFLVLLSTITSPRRDPLPPEQVTLRSLGAGLGFVWRNKILLGALTLDMLAVLLGGAVALLPVYARDILKVGPMGLGFMQAAPAVGAGAMAVIMAHRPPMAKAGKALLWSVAGFGAATIVFGVSRWFWLSLAMLFLTGAFDNISVIVRHTLVQLLTPDAMRGRVSAVNSMFIGTSNELGGFESGFVAEWLGRLLAAPVFGTILCVAGGGVGTILVAAAVALKWPEVRRYGRLGGDPHEQSV
jgi:MFS family permease